MIDGCSRVQIYRNAQGYDCTNGGISAIERGAAYLSLYAEGETVENVAQEGCASAFLMRGNLPGTVKIVPVGDDGRPTKQWAMFGGNFAYTSDSRFHRAVEAITGNPHSYGPVPIHDRFE